MGGSCGWRSGGRKREKLATTIKSSGPEKVTGETTCGVGSVGVGGRGRGRHSSALDPNRGACVWPANKSLSPW